KNFDSDHSGFARTNHFNRFAFHIRLSTTATDGPEDFSPRRHYHFGAHFPRRRPLRRHDGRHRQSLTLVEELLHLMIDGVFLLCLRTGVIKTCSLTCHFLTSKSYYDDRKSMINDADLD